MEQKNLVKILKEGGVAVLPTDTLYGFCASAFSKDAVEKIYTLKKRDPRKALIVLISCLDDLKSFGIELEKYEAKLKEIWPGRVSVVLPCDKEELSYLHRGGKSIAFRIPDKKDLLELLERTGPLVAPSANPEGREPAKNIEEAKKYFADEVELYVDGGELFGDPSTLVSFDDKKNFIIERKGAVKL